MPIEKIKKSKELIDQVEQYLQNGLSSNVDFNDALDTGELLKIVSLKDEDHTHLYKSSEVLFWVDRSAYFDEFESWNGEQLKDKHKVAIDYMFESKQESVISDLIILIRKNKIAPFLGAGISVAAGYPSWGNTLKDIGSRLHGLDVTEIEQLLSDEKYLTLAEKIFNISSSQLNNHIRTTFRTKVNIEEDRNQVPEVIKILPRLCSGAMITTNFDTLIEDWFKSNVAPEFDGVLHGLQSNHNFITKLLRGDRCLLKLHGDAAQPDSQVFTESQYEKGYGKQDVDFRLQLPKSLRQIYVSHSLLFLGCSLKIDKTMELFEKIRADDQFEIPDHFALMPLPFLSGTDSKIDDSAKHEAEERLFNIGIRPIWYRNEDDHKMMQLLLDLIVDVAENRFSFGSKK